MEKPQGINKGLIVDETTDYIQYLMQGAGTTINFDQIREELNQQSRSVQSDPTVSFSDTQNSTSLDQFNTFLKNQNDPEMSRIQQSAFFAPRDSRRSISGRSSLKSRSMATDDASQREEKYNFLIRPVKEVSAQKEMTFSELNSTPNSMRSPSQPSERFSMSLPPSGLSETEKQLHKLSKQLELAGFSSLHPSLLKTSGSSDTPNALSDIQALYLISTVSILISECQSRSNALQQHSAPSGTVSETSSRVLALEQEIAALKAQKKESDYLVDKLKFENASLLKNIEITNSRNEQALRAVKQQYNFEGSNIIIEKIVAAYESRIEELQNLFANRSSHYDDISEYSGQTSISVDVKIRQKMEALHRELEKVQEERDLLQLRLMNQSKTWTREQIDAKPDPKGVSTRYLIQQDKKHWRQKSGFIEGQSNDEMKSMLREICTRLGIRDQNNIGRSVEKIQLVVRLVPQMEKFIRDVNAVIQAYELNSEKSVNNSNVAASRKLSYCLKVIREWADTQLNVKEQTEFIKAVHQNLYVPLSPGSYESCLAELCRVVEAQSPSKLYSHVSVDVAQQAVEHFKNLFELPSANSVLPKMNDLFVFWAEVNDGLLRLREALKIDKNVQPGRVLINASEFIETHSVSR